MRLQPLHDWLLVKLDPEPAHMFGTIHVLGSAIPRVFTASVVRVGAGKVNKNTGARIPHFIEPGMKVAFFRENLEHQQGKQLQAKLAELEDGYALLRASDLLGEVVTSETVADAALRDAFVGEDPYPPLPHAFDAPPMSARNIRDMYPPNSAAFPEEMPLVGDIPGAERVVKTPV